MKMFKRTFQIEWDEDLGPLWMNVYNLSTCLNTKNHIGDDIGLLVSDITDCPAAYTEKAKKFLANPEIDEDSIVTAIAWWLARAR